MSLKQALELCGIQDGEWFSVAAIRDRDIRPGCFCDISQAEAFLAQYSGWNQYLCGNPVKPNTVGKPKLDDVLEARVMLIDADPQEEGADTAAAIAKVCMWFRSNTSNQVHPATIDSGRGTQAWLRTALQPGERRALLRHLARECATPGVKFDATHNAERLMRLPGSVNLKTNRIAKVAAEGRGIFESVDFIRLHIPEQDPIDPTKTVFVEGVASQTDLAYMPPQAKMVWDEPIGKEDRSKRDFRFVLACIRAKVDEDITCRLLRAMPGSKFAQDQRGEDYWRSTMESVRRHLKDEADAIARARLLPEQAKTDPGAPFEERALDDLLLVRDGDEAEWQRLRAAIKAARVPVRALEKAMDDRRRAGVEFEPVALRFVADDLKRVGWFKRTREDGWVSIDGSEARSTMRAQGQDADVEIKAHTDAPWSLVNEPFQPEELEGRRWNKDGAQLAIKPEPGSWTSWRLMLSHVGRSLDDLIKNDPWCKKVGIRDGGDYLFVWIAAMLQRPKARCAYLFLHGEQEAGKSTLHEALRLLLARGYVRANHALKSKEGFNGEIANAILCVIEEVDLSDPRRDTHERVKDWVTGEVVSVRALYRQAVDYVNTTHWIQCAQKRAFMPVLPGDTCITEIHVEKAEKPIAKETLLADLAREAPAFLSASLAHKLHEPSGRLYVPALATQGKEEQAMAAQTMLEHWLATSGNWLESTDSVLAGAFLDWLPSGSKQAWDFARVMRELPPQARADRRLVAALRPALRGALGGAPCPVSSLLRALPPGAAADYKNNVQLGKALRRVQPNLSWLETVTVNGADVWRLKEGT